MEPPAKLRSSRQGLRANILSGLRWSFTSTGVSTAIQIAHMMIMARLLTPADFGLVALAMAFLRFGTYFSQLGVGHALIQRPTLNEREIRTAFTTSVVLGLLLTVLFYSLAPFATSVVDAPEVVSVIQMLALSMIIAGLGTTAISLLKRDLRFKGLAFIEVGSYLFGYVFVGITLAMLGFGVWSLVFAALAQALLQTMAAYAMSRHVSRPMLGWIEIKTLYGYGGKYSVTQLLSAGRHALNTSAVGYVAGVTALGLFDRARMLVKLPFYKVDTSISKVLFPGMSRVQSDASILGRIFLLQKAIVASIFLPALAGMAVSAELIIRVILGPGWLEAASMVPFLAVAVGILFLAQFSRSVADTRALMTQRIAIDFLHLNALAVFIVVGSRYGIAGILVAIIMAEIFAYAAYLKLIQESLSIKWKSIMLALSPGLISTVIIGASLYGSTILLNQFAVPALPAMLFQVALGGFLLILMWSSKLFRFVRSEVVFFTLPRSNGDALALDKSEARRRLLRILLGTR